MTLKDRILAETQVSEPNDRDNELLAEYLFKKEDYDALLYNIYDIPIKTDLLIEFKSLAKIAAFRNAKFKIDKNLVIRYIILFYDKSSPAEIISDYQKKKVWCALHAGWNSNAKGLFDPAVDEIRKGKNEQANEMIIAYLREFGSNMYAQLKIGTDAYYNKLRQINQDQGDTKKTDLELERIRGYVWEQCNTMESDLEKLAERFLRDKSPFLKESLFCTINNEANKNLMISPEQRAQII